MSKKTDVEDYGDFATTRFLKGRGSNLVLVQQALEVFPGLDLLFPDNNKDLLYYTLDCILSNLAYALQLQINGLNKPTFVTIPFKKETWAKEINSPNLSYVALIKITDHLINNGFIEKVKGFYDLETKTGRRTQLKIDENLISKVIISNSEKSIKNRYLDRGGVGEVPFLRQELPAFSFVEELYNFRFFSDSRFGYSLNRDSAKNFISVNKRLSKTISFINEVNSKHTWAWIKEFTALDKKTNTVKTISFEESQEAHQFYHNCLVSLNRLTGVRYKGGRIYSDFTHMPSKYRKQLKIDSEATAELDLKANQITILYGLERLPIPPEPYGIGPMQPYNKLASMIILNASSYQEALGGLRGAILDEGLPPLKDCILKTIIEEMREINKPIAKYFFTGCGVWLQGYEGEIAIEVMRQLAELNIPSTNIHDSWCVKVSDQEIAKKIIETTVYKKFGYIPTVRVK